VLEDDALLERDPIEQRRAIAVEARAENQVCARSTRWIESTCRKPMALDQLRDLAAEARRPGSSSRPWLSSKRRALGRQSRAASRQRTLRASPEWRNDS